MGRHYHRFEVEIELSYPSSMAFLKKDDILISQIKSKIFHIKLLSSKAYYILIKLQIFRIETKIIQFWPFYNF